MCVSVPAGAFSEPKIARPRVFPQPQYQLWRNGARGAGIEPPDLQTRSEDHSTRLFSPQNIGSAKISYVSKTENVCALPAGAFSEPKIATLCSFGTDNSSFCVFNAEFEDF